MFFYIFIYNLYTTPKSTRVIKIHVKLHIHFLKNKQKLVFYKYKMIQKHNFLVTTPYILKTHCEREYS